MILWLTDPHWVSLSQSVGDSVVKEVSSPTEHVTVTCVLFSACINYRVVCPSIVPHYSASTRWFPFEEQPHQ